MGGIGERAYLGATLERVDELLGEADGSFAGGVLVTVQAENSIASERLHARIRMEKACHCALGQRNWAVIPLPNVRWRLRRRF